MSVRFRNLLPDLFGPFGSHIMLIWGDRQPIIHQHTLCFYLQTERILDSLREESVVVVGDGWEAIMIKSEPTATDSIILWTSVGGKWLKLSLRKRENLRGRRDS